MCGEISSELGGQRQLSADLKKFPEGALRPSSTSDRCPRLGSPVPQGIKLGLLPQPHCRQETRGVAILHKRCRSTHSRGNRAPASRDPRGCLSPTSLQASWQAPPRPSPAAPHRVTDLLRFKHNRDEAQPYLCSQSAPPHAPPTHLPTPRPSLCLFQTFPLLPPRPQNTNKQATTQPFRASNPGEKSNVREGLGVILCEGHIPFLFAEGGGCSFLEEREKLSLCPVW